MTKPNKPFLSEKHKKKTHCKCKYLCTCICMLYIAMNGKNTSRNEELENRINAIIHCTTVPYREVLWGNCSAHWRRNCQEQKTNLMCITAEAFMMQKQLSTSMEFFFLSNFYIKEKIVVGLNGKYELILSPKKNSKVFSILFLFFSIPFT